MLLYDILNMENIVESSPRTTTTTTTRRLRSLHLPSSSSSGSATNEISRRFNSLRRPNNHNNTTTTTNTQSPLGHNLITPPISSPPLITNNHDNENDFENTNTAISTTPVGDIPQNVHIKLVPNVGMTNRCFVFDVVDRELESDGPALKLGRYSDRTVVTDRISFKSKVNI
jgi:hypothetical protein